MLTFVLFGAMLVLFTLGVPIAFSLGLAAMTAILVMMPGVSLEVVVQRMFHGLNSFVLLAVPLFLLLGDLMEAAKITDRLVEFTRTVVGRLRGGLGHVAIASEMILSGISGSGTADAAALGVVLVPMMVKTGYPNPFTTALLGAAATLGPVIPPSIIMVIYAAIANVSVGRMLLGGIVPGVIMGLFLMATTAMMARRLNLPRGEQASLGQVMRATKRASLVILAPLIVIVGIVGGAFTATESAGIACVYALVLGVAVYRTVALKDLPRIFSTSAVATGKVIFVLATASIFSWILARGGVPAQMARLPFFSEGAKPWVILLALNILWLIMGCLMDSLAILLVTAPMFLPLTAQAGLDPIHLGVVMVLNLSIGMATPPFGTAMFVLCGISRCTIWEFSREVWPFILALIVVLILTTYIPALVLFLPNLLMGTAR